jgi:hypothetical protein
VSATASVQVQVRPRHRDLATQGGELLRPPCTAPGERPSGAILAAVPSIFTGEILREASEICSVKRTVNFAEPTDVIDSRRGFLGCWRTRMSFVIAAPQFVTAAASNLANIGSAFSTANVAAPAPTTGLLAAGTDEVSATIAALFAGHAQAYHARSA